MSIALKPFHACNPLLSADSKLKQFIYLSIGFALLIAAMQLSIPLDPVPLTFQSASVILIGMSYGRKQGAAIVAAYLLAGICGLPVFSGFTSGLQKFLSPTGGYLLAFLPAVYVSGMLAEYGFAKRFYSALGTALCGTILIFAGGLTGLTLLFNFKFALAVGFIPFIISEPIKLIVIAALIPKLWK